MKIETIKFDMGSRYAVPVSMISILAEHQDKADALVGQTVEKMNQELVALREKLLKEMALPQLIRQSPRPTIYAPRWPYKQR